jgi:LDH2 family malate/lactate/ureidoglycolate dehydrogenase
MRVPAETIKSHLTAVFRAWGMSDEHARTTALMMAETDLRGVDSHGISMLPTYDKEFRSGRLNMRPVWKTLREGPATARSTPMPPGHPVSPRHESRGGQCRGRASLSFGAQLAHFWRRRLLLKIAADRGGIGTVMSTRGVTLVPTFAAEPVMGTNPIAFAAPARRNPPFQLDMGTTTVAAGKIKVHKLNHRTVPSGWVVDGDGKPVTDEGDAFGYVFDKTEGGITPLGGTREVGGAKGLRPAVMVHILGATLSAPRSRADQEPYAETLGPAHTSHFFLASTRGAFRADGEFEEDLDQVIDTLHGASRRPEPARAGRGRSRAGHARGAARAWRPDSRRPDGAVARRGAAGQRAVHAGVVKTRDGGTTHGTAHHRRQGIRPGRRLEDDAGYRCRSRNRQGQNL